MKDFLYRLALYYFRYFARYQLQKNPRATIIGITGSAGKTSTRLALVHILRHRGVVKHSLHANSEIGIPLNILGLTPRSLSILDWLRLLVVAPIRLLTFNERFTYYVVEMGIDSPRFPGNMSYLLSIVQPHVGVVLGAGLAHAANFDHLVKDMSSRRAGKLLREVAKEKMQLVKSLPKSGIAIVNGDQKELVSELKDVRARRLTFGRGERCDLVILGDDRFRYLDNTYKLEVKGVYPRSFIYSFAAAVATAASIGIPPSISLPLLSSYEPPRGRSRLFAGAFGSHVIDSSYNASPSTMLESLILLKQCSGRKKKIALLGDMRELGSLTKISHKNLADWIMEYTDEAILFGEYTREFTLPVLKSKKFPVSHFTQMSKLTEYLKTRVTKDSYILVKGSQNQLFMERAVESILADPKDISRLPRRGPRWDKIRAKTP